MNPMKLNYKTKEELIANIKLSIARKNECIARSQREWAEQNLERVKSVAL